MRVVESVMQIVWLSLVVLKPSFVNLLDIVCSATLTTPMFSGERKDEGR
jgi:hypothetical protein